MEASDNLVDTRAKQHFALQLELVRLKREERALTQFYEKLTAQSSALKLEGIRLKALFKKSSETSSNIND